MIKLYGNEIWNSNTPNQYKKVIIASESRFESITDALENAGLNYCGYINKNKSYIAVGRATVPNLEKLNISYDSIVDSNNRKYVTNNIIGTTKYNDIGDKMYRKYNTDFAYKVAQRLSEQDIPFSGRIFGKNTTITVDNIYKDAINAIAHEIREQRELLYNDKAVEKNQPSATVKNSVTVSKEDNTENLFNALSVLHYKAHQLESLNSTVELLNDQPELIDTFSTMFEDTSDFKPEQLNMLSMNFVKTYSGLSDSELILANTADFNEIKQSFINTNLADKLIENHGYSYAQSELIRDMVDMGIDYDTINLLDYTFSLTEMQTFIGAYSRSDYDSLINLVTKVKGVTRSEVEGMISDGTYTPALPDFNTLEKTLYFQESEVESITYMYYNPDAYSGGQFVITEVSYKQIAEANKKYGDDFSGFFDFLDTTGEQRLIDIGSESFRTAVKKFYSGTEFAEGLNADIQHKLVELAVVPEIKSPEVRKIELIKVGDFYEVRGENAKTVADILDLVSTTRNINGSSVDTVGFPDFKLNDNTELLKTQGFTVNIKYEGLVDLSNEFNKLISEQKKITSNVSDKHTIVINAFAGPGAGKTTSCLEVAEKLKKQGFVTEYVQEYAKELVYDNNLIMLDGHYEHQFDILKEQVKRINRLYGKVDFILTDSPVLLNNTYLNEDKSTNDYVAYCENVKKIYTLYDNFNYFVERDKSAFEEEGRIHNLEQSIVIDDELKNTLHNNQIDFATYTHSTIDNIVRDSVLAYAKQLINLYCNDEFDSEADFSDLKKVGVAYTTTEDSKHTVEAVVNLVDYRLETYVDDKLFKEETYADLKDMIDNCLHSLSFDDLVYLSDEELAPFYEEHDELDDIDPAVIRQQLEDAGIVNGELVDEDKLNSDPFIQQVMTDKAPARKCADVDQAALSYGEIKALCTGDDRIREKLTLDNRVKELNSLKADYNNTKYELEDAVAAYPEKRKQLLCTIGNIKSDIDNVKSFVDKDGKLICKLTLGSQTFNLKNDEERKNAAKALTTAVAQVRIADNRKKQVSVGNICGFDISVINNGNVYDDILVTIKGKYSYSAQLGVSAVHNLSKIEGLLYKTESVLDYSQNSLNKLDLDYKTSVALLEKPFEYEAELQEKSARLSELTKILNIELAHQKTESKSKTHYFGKDKILGRNKSSKQVQNKTVMKSEPKRSEPEL